MRITRRRLLATTAGAVAVGTTAGCVGGSAGGGSNAGSRTVQSSFFVFGDVVGTVAGDVADTGLLVPIGQHGHGWEPGPRVREAIHDASLLVHGPVGFQPWVDDILGDLEADGSGVRTVDISTGLDLLAAADGHDHGDDEEHGEETHHTDSNEHDEVHEGGPDDEHGAEHTADHSDEGREEDDHGAEADPHFWMDPVRLGESAGTVRDALVDVDSEHADAYETNAETYRTELDALDERIETTVSDAERDVLLVAGHNSLRYFGDRYGVEIEALTRVSPDDRPTPRDIERAQEIIEEHGLRYVCADPLESQRAADQLVEETDAEAVLPLTSMPGLTDEWDAEGWGYRDVMENVNLPSIERALNA
ncbi:metal ABC transporter substrate-binding protein [Halobellus captivus]|uniref:metal ABC transporter substrate-binding protein n=1 Tax=Halobellus captivus TaxID=2592614 RepID=UPI0011A9FAA9|nr:metal ABC transporter substrate-binding protein [Halobellus captivus]